jgi:hypothetical protein
MASFENMCEDLNFTFTYLILHHFNDYFLLPRFPNKCGHPVQTTTDWPSLHKELRISEILSLKYLMNLAWMKVRPLVISSYFEAKIQDDSEEYLHIRKSKSMGS